MLPAPNRARRNDEFFVADAQDSRALAIRAKIGM